MVQCSVTPKVCLTILTVFFWACAAGLLYIGATVYVQFSEYEKVTEYMYTLLPAAIVMAVAALLFIIGLVGCVGAFKEQRCLLGLYFTILMVILMAAVAGGVLGYIYRVQVDAGLSKGLQQGLNEYGNNTAWSQEIDMMQEKLHCCGVNNASDWLATPWHKTHSNMTAPASCYTDQHVVANTSHIYDTGCYNYVRQQFMDHLGIIAGVSCGFATILLIGMVCSCLLLCHRRHEQPYIGLSSPDHMRV